ncbi:MAG TPA: TonB-dependent receptor [Steroidobacteraceae bacterium]|nr:TonB-dependent receptor [Steroidobacteraceae bacterium]
MLPRSLRACVLAALLCAPVALAAVPPPAAPLLSAAIAPQPLGAALKTYQDLTGLQGAYVADIVAGAHSRGARAGLVPAEALTRLLRGTGLTFEFLNERTFTVSARRRTATPPAPPPTSDNPAQQIIITAARGGEPLSRVPVDAFVWSADALQASGVKTVADLSALTPVVAFDFFSSVGSGVYTDLAIRGIIDRHGSATGIFFDDIALPAARSNTFGRALPFYFDIKSIEVWRGPQGTLLGADTQGGAVKFVPNDPDLTQASGLARTEWAVTARGGPSYEAGAAAGGPLLPEQLGFRLSAWYRADGGYVDRVDPFTGSVVDASSNRVSSRSARAALTWAPTEALSITPSLSYVSARAHDSPSFFTYPSDPSAGVLDNGSLVPQPFDDTFHLASVKVSASGAAAAFTSLTAYYHRAGNLTVDDTESVKWGGWGNPLGPAFPSSYANAVVTYTRLRQDLFSQELRLRSAHSDSPLTWLAGLAYSNTRDTESYRVVGQYIPVLAGPLDSSNSTTTAQHQLAGYGLVERLLLRHFTLSAGLRLEYDEYDSSSLAAPVFQGTEHHTLVVPRLSLSYESGGHDVGYVSAARGYSPAGVDAALPTCFENPMPYPADTVWSYELGWKIGLFEGAARVNATVFEARWNNGPAVTGNCLVTHVPGGAASSGFELAADATLSESRQLRAMLALSYIDARYTDTVRSGGVLIVNRGDALGTPPVVTSPWNLTAALERDLLLGERTRLAVRAEDAFHSRNPGPFYTGISGSPFFAPGLGSDPSTNLVNLRASARLDRLEIATFLDNVFDAQPTLLKRNKGVDVSNLYYATTFRPRTLGVAASWRF